jgi:hypothetical protein
MMLDWLELIALAIGYGVMGAIGFMVLFGAILGLAGMFVIWLVY